MPTITPWLLGKHVSVFTLTPLTVAGNGTISEGSPSSLVGLWEEVDISSRPRQVEISPADATRENNVTVKTSTSIRLSVILKSNGVNILTGLLVAGDYFKLVLTRGPQTWTYYGIQGDFEESIREGKCTGVLTLQMVDPNATNPAYA